MMLPKPEIGMVIRYSYLWAREAHSGRDEGVKDRPCAIVLAAQTSNGQTRIQVLPITHVPPSNPNDAIEIPTRVKEYLQLDDERSWVVLSEYNEFLWPGYDLRPVGNANSPIYGFLPQKFFQLVASLFLARLDSTATKRT